MGPGTKLSTVVQPPPAGATHANVLVSTCQYADHRRRTNVMPIDDAINVKLFADNAAHRRGAARQGCGPDNLPDVPLIVGVHEAQIARWMPEQCPFGLAPRVERCIGQRDEAHRVLDQPGVIGGGCQRRVQQRITRQVDLPIPAARQRHLLGDVFRFPMVAGERDFDTTEWLLVGVEVAATCRRSTTASSRDRPRLKKPQRRWATAGR